MFDATLWDIRRGEKRLKEMEFRAAREWSDEVRRATLMRALGDPFPHMRTAAARLLAHELDDDLVEDFIALLGRRRINTPGAPDPTDTVARAAAVALAHAAGDARAERALASALEDADADVRYQALTGLFELGASDATLSPRIEDLLYDDDEEVCVVAAQIAAARGYTHVLETLIGRRERLFGTAKLQLTLSLAELWATHPEERDADLALDVIDELSKALKNEVTVAAAARAIAMLARPGAEAQRAVAALREPLKRWMLHPILKVEVAGALAELDDADGVAYLGQQLRSQRKDARGYAIEVAGRLGLKRLFEEVARTASGRDYHNETAVLALGSYGTPEAVRVLETLAREHPEEGCREVAAQTLNAMR
ncbi:MAG: HEAT repeat domain-containing protein [Myxococcota bacterium]